MKKIIPFNNVLQFNTDVREITAISLEHEIKKYPDMISGVFYISGEYKITEGLIDKEKFNFELPFDIALSTNYELDTLLVDIDDFRYELVSDKSLKVNIDLYIDGTEITESPKNVPNEDKNLTNNILSQISQDEVRYDEEFKEEKIINEDQECEETYGEENYHEEYPDAIEIKSITEEDNIEIEPDRIDLLKDMLTNDKENNMTEDSNLNVNNNNENESINNNIFTPNQEEEKYVTYRVYKVLDTDTIDSILSKYNITKEMLADYNNIENITPGDKLIIPTNEK